MSSRLRTPALVLTTLSIALSIAVLACAADSLRFFNSQQSSNAWLLPIWPNHFDTRGLAALVGTSVAIIVLNAAVLVALFVPALPAPLTTFISSFLTSALALLAVAFPAVLNRRAPRLDTLQTWTCRLATSTPSSPSHFQTLCHETRFAFYTTIPLLLLQLLLLATAVSSLLATRRSAHTHGSVGEVEKQGHEMGEFGRVGGSFETVGKGSPKSTATESARILGVKG